MNDTARKFLAPTVFIVASSRFWEWAVWYNDLPDFRMASPSDLIPRYVQFWDLFLIKSWETLWRTVVGLAWPWWSAR
jgi:NitT/TauT family transport system permease protein